MALQRRILRNPLMMIGQRLEEETVLTHRSNTCLASIFIDQFVKEVLMLKFIHKMYKLGVVPQYY